MIKWLVFATAIIGLPGVVASAEKVSSESRSPEQLACELNPETCARIPLGSEAPFSLIKQAPASAVNKQASTPSNQQVKVAHNKAEWTKAPAKQPVAVLVRVNFGVNSAELSPDAQAEVRSFAAALKLPAMATKRYAVQGHTDASGNHEANIALSKARAEAVVALLKDNGVAETQVVAEGYGPDRLLKPRSPANRRVQMVPLG